MSDEERQKQMDFILDQQAQLVATVGRLSENVERLSTKVDRTADSVIALLAIAEIHDREIGELRAAAGEWRAAAKETDERLNALIGIVERRLSGGQL